VLAGNDKIYEDVFNQSGVIRARSLRSRPGMTNSGIGPIQPGSDRETYASRQRIDDEILEPRVPSGDKELQQFERPDHDD
jgi:hypothetical protein